MRNWSRGHLRLVDSANFHEHLNDPVRWCDLMLFRNSHDMLAGCPHNVHAASRHCWGCVHVRVVRSLRNSAFCSPADRSVGRVSFPHTRKRSANTRLCSSVPSRTRELNQAKCLPKCLTRNDVNHCDVRTALSPKSCLGHRVSDDLRSSPIYAANLTSRSTCGCLCAEPTSWTNVH